MYLRIMNPGTCDYRCFTVLGVSGSRENESKIGQFGSGAKFGRNALLRGGLAPIICIGNLKLEFNFRPTIIDGKEYRQVFVDLSGKLDDSTVRRSEDLQMTLEHGVYDWQSIIMGLREFIANAIDGCNDFKDVTVDIVDTPRAKRGYTQVFIPYNEDVANFIKALPDLFLHFSKNDPKTEIISKKEPGPCRIYHKGVFIRTIGTNSVYNYNCPSLVIDESRNSDEWECRTAVAKTLSKHTNEFANVLRQVAANSSLFEASLNQYYWTHLKEDVEKAYKSAYGDDAVICTVDTQEYVNKKGYRPVCLPEGYAQVLRTCDRLKKDSDVLNHAEIHGLDEVEPNHQIIKSFNEVWETLVYLKKTNGKNKPQLKAFKKPMDGGSKLCGHAYKENTIYVSDDIGGKELYITIIEELTHHITGSGDMSRDIQDFAFSVIAEMIHN